MMQVVAVIETIKRLNTIIALPVLLSGAIPSLVTMLTINLLSL